MGVRETLRTLFGRTRTASASVPVLVPMPVPSLMSTSVPVPDDAQAVALIEQGNALEESGQLVEAAQCYEAALKIAPQLPRAHLNRGNILLAAGDAPAAIDAYQTALLHDPAYAGAHFNLGNALLRSNRPEAALASYKTAVRLAPGFADAHVAIGAALEDLDQAGDAIEHYQAALTLQPGYAPVHSNLGNALRNVGRFAEAIASHRRALTIDPTLVQAHNNLGSVLKDMASLDAAEASYRQALALQPDDLDARSNLLFLHNYRATYTPAQLLEEAQEFGRLASRRARHFETWSGSRDANRCLQIGLVSGDFRNHPVGFFLDSVIGALAAANGRLQLTAYATARCDDGIATSIKAHCHRWRDAQGLPDDALAMQIRNDAIDILLDLSGHTAHSRLPLFAWKPAPVQVSWLGYFATTGVAEIDYLIADPWTLPESQAAWFTEAIWRLPETRLCFTAPLRGPAVSSLPALGTGHITFGCFNNLAKLGDEVIALWARVLESVPGSRLMLKSPPLREPELQRELHARFAQHGIAAERLALDGLSSREGYLATYGQIDIALDPFPFPGGTTTVESMWMGVPVLTLAGESFLARQGVGLLMNAGLPDWIAADADDYLRLAVKHAADLPALASLRVGLRQQLLASPLMDAERFAIHFEQALRGMWKRWCEIPPAVPPVA